MYAAQRWTGAIAFIYIVWHTYTMRFTGIHLLTTRMPRFTKCKWSSALVGRSVLCDRNHRRFVAFRLWDLSVLRQMGHHRERNVAQVDGPGVYCACAHFDYRRVGDDGVVLQAAVAQHPGGIAGTAERGKDRTLGLTTKDTKEHRGLENCKIDKPLSYDLQALIFGIGKMHWDRKTLLRVPLCPLRLEKVYGIDSENYRGWRRARRALRPPSRLPKPAVTSICSQSFRSSARTPFALRAASTRPRT